MTPARSPAGLFRGVDRAAFVASFAERLRRSGLPVSFGALERSTASMNVAGPVTLTDLYWILRVNFVGDRGEPVSYTHLTLPTTPY